MEAASEMQHYLSETEQLAVDALLEEYDFDFVPVRLTRTMLEKSIIDARAPIRAMLSRAGLVDFAAIEQGVEYKVRIPMPLVTSERAEHRSASCYRPNTKDGDPRIWIERFATVASVGDLLAFASSGDGVVAILVRGSAKELARNLRPFVRTRFEGRAQIEARVRQLQGELLPLRDQWVKTRRSGPTGVGFTLESLLGLKANSRRTADFDGIELKSYRRETTGTDHLVTLFSKTPRWVDDTRGAGLLNRFGYFDEERGRQALYCTVTVKPNSLGLRLELMAEAARIELARGGEQCAYYTFATLEERLNEKHPSTLFVKASTRGSGPDEEFRYDEVTYCMSPSFSGFMDLAEQAALGLDLTLHRKPSGSTRDHGYLWRVRESRIPELYGYRRVLSGGA